MAVSRAQRALAELGGSLGDMGTFVPLVLGAVTLAGLPACGVLAGFGLFYLASAALYRAPIPVQPMKAVAAVLLTSGLSAAQVAAAGLLLGLAMLALALSGLIDALARLIPRSVVTGLQLGLGIALAILALELMGEAPLLAVATLAATALLLRVPGLPATLLVLAGAVAAGQWLALAPALPALRLDAALPGLLVPGVQDLAAVAGSVVAPQLALTVTNAVILTAALSRDLLGERARRATPRNLALSTGAANLLLAPLGALPMCHGAGGLAAHVRFGAHSGAGIGALGALLLALGLLAPEAATALLLAVPTAAVGALLAVAALELAWSRRLLEARPACLPVIGVTAAAAVLVDPLAGLAAGWATELAAGAVARRAQRG